MKVIVQHRFGITPDDLIKETARVFGFKKMGKKIEDKLEDVYYMLLRVGELEEFEEITGKTIVKRHAG